MVRIPTTGRGAARPATDEEIQRETIRYYLSTDGEEYMTDDIDEFIISNTPDFGYTNPNLHRRIDNEAQAAAGPGYSFINYDESGKPYPQEVKLGIWDGRHSYRTTETITHDEESETCEIP